MTTNPTSVHEAHALLLAAIMRNPPHNIRYEADEDDWRERIEHLARLGAAVDLYLHELGRDCAQHAHCSFDLKYFRGPVADAFDDMLGQMERAMEAARKHETLPAE